MHIAKLIINSVRKTLLYKNEIIRSIFSICFTITINSNQNIKATFEQLNAIYLDENGVTIKAYDSAVVGEVYELGVDSYTVVDNELLTDFPDCINCNRAICVVAS